MQDFDEPTNQSIKAQLSGICVLLLEDEALYSRGMIDLLLKHGVARVDLFEVGEAARDAAIAGTYEALLLDRRNTGMDGLSALRAIRQSGRGSYAAPALMITSLGEQRDRVEGYNGGADDYITKPVDGVELLARLAAKIRRNSPGIVSENEGVLTNGPLVVDERNEVATFFGEKIEKLTARPFSVLCALMRVRGLPLTSSMVFRQCWPSWNHLPDGWEDRVFKEIQRLRNALEPYEARLPGDSRPVLVTLRGKGYRLRDLTEINALTASSPL